MITTLPDYQEETAHNEQKFKEMAKLLRPDLYVLLDLLEVTRVSPYILFKTVKHISNIANGSKWGEIVIHLADGNVSFISGVENDKVEEPALLDERKIL